MRQFICRTIIKKGEMHTVFISILLSLMIFLMSFAATCDGGDTLPSDIDSSLVSQLQTEYSTYRASTTPPLNAFTNYENSVQYSFWDAGHINWNQGWALNTSDEKYSGIAIIRYYVEMDKKADEVMFYYWQIDSTALILPISSAYRNPARNSTIPNSSTNSYHIYGQAIDFDTDNTVAHGQEVWDAASETSTTQLLNEPGNRNYRPIEDDIKGSTNWIHAGWGPTH